MRKAKLFRLTIQLFLELPEQNHKKCFEQNFRQWIKLRIGSLLCLYGMGDPEHIWVQMIHRYTFNQNFIAKDQAVKLRPSSLLISFHELFT